MAVHKTKKRDDLTNKNVNSNDNIVLPVTQTEIMAVPLWGGHFSANNNELMQKHTTTINIDRRVYAAAIESTKATMRMHIKREIIPANEGRQLIDALDKVKREFADGSFELKSGARDIYDNIDRRISEIAPEAYLWFNVARTKSSQVAGDHKLWTRDAVDSMDSSLQNLLAALIDKAEENVKTIFPGNAHNQLTQPISFGHHLVAYIEMFKRDRERIKDARKRLNVSAYTSGEIAGSSYHLNREMVARILGCDSACTNSIEAINSRDYMVEFLAIASNTATHLSRLANEMINWHSTQKQYISFSNAFVTQSQIVPYRRDPEGLEMIRGRASKVYSALFNILSTLKDLPLEFCNDYICIAEDLFNAYDILLNNINAMATLVADFTVNRKQMKEAAVGNFSTAIDLADWLVRNTNSNFEQAQEQTRRLIEYAISKDTKLSLLELSEIKKIISKATDEIYSVLIPSRAIIARRSGNGSSPVQIRKNIRRLRRECL